MPRQETTNYPRNNNATFDKSNRGSGSWNRNRKDESNYTNPNQYNKPNNSHRATMSGFMAASVDAEPEYRPRKPAKRLGRKSLMQDPPKTYDSETGPTCWADMAMADGPMDNAPESRFDAYVGDLKRPVADLKRHVGDLKRHVTNPPLTHPNPSIKRYRPTPGYEDPYAAVGGINQLDKIAYNYKPEDSYEPGEPYEPEDPYAVSMEYILS